MNIEALIVAWVLVNLVLLVGMLDIILSARWTLGGDFQERWNEVHDDVTPVDFNLFMRYLFGLTFWGAWIATGLIGRFFPVKDVSPTNTKEDK